MNNGFQVHPRSPKERHTSNAITTVLKDEAIVPSLLSNSGEDVKESMAIVKD